MVQYKVKTSSRLLALIGAFSYNLLRPDTTKPDASNNKRAALTLQVHVASPSNADMERRDLLKKNYIIVGIAEVNGSPA